MLHEVLQIMLFAVLLCHLMSRYVIRYYVMLCSAILRCARLCCVTLCFVPMFQARNRKPGARTGGYYGLQLAHFLGSVPGELATIILNCRL